jgi:hypothetical protein
MGNKSGGKWREMALFPTVPKRHFDVAEQAAVDRNSSI